MSVENMTRRQLLRKAAALGAGMALAGPVLAACGPTPTPKVVEKVVTQVVTQVVQKEITKIVAGTPVKEVVKETIVVEKPVEKVVTKEVEKLVTVAPAVKGVKEIRITVAAWTDQFWQLSRRTNVYNTKMTDQRIIVEPQGEGWDTKSLAQIQSGKPPIWSGFMSRHAFRFGVYDYLTGMTQYIDDYFKASKVVNFEEFWKATLKPDLMQYDASVKGKLVGVPLSMEMTCYHVNSDFMKQAGNPSTREEIMKQYSWAKIHEWGLNVKNKLKGIWGMNADNNVPHQCSYHIMQSISSDLFDDKGLFKFDSDDFRRAMKILKDMIDAGLMPNPPWNPEGFEAFPNGLAAQRIGQVGHVGRAQAVHGTKTIPYAMPPCVEKGGTGGQHWYCTFACVFSLAQYPQETVDYYLSIFGPQDEDMPKMSLAANWFPIFRHHWDKYAVGDNAWVKDFLPYVEKGKIIPRMPYHEIEVTVNRKWLELYFQGKETLEGASKGMMKEILDEIAKMKLQWP